MADPLPSLDLRLTPDWLKESESGNRYADYTNVETDGRGQRDRRDRRDDRPRRPPQNRQRRDGTPPRRDSGGPNRPATGGPNRPASQSPARPARPQGQPSRDTAPGSRPERLNEGLRRDRDEPVQDQVEPAAVQVDFLPEERAFSKVIQQIKQGHAAYPLFGLARMFLERPERHRIRIRSLNDAVMVYQLGDDGPVAMETAILERIAFHEKKDDFYTSEIIEKEPIKGNFTSVARCGLSGRLLGPTNYHTFQKVIRALYEQRFSRRMSFEEYRRSIEITSDPTLVNQWKEEARKVVTYLAKDQENPAAFENVAAMEQHFRTYHLDQLIKPCLAVEISGDMARHLPDRSIISAIRRARERENRFPAQMAGALRHGLNQAGLHVFKHKKRILYISTIRPQLFDPNQAKVSAGLEAILATLRSYPRITRKQLAEKVLKRLIGEKSTDENSPEYLQARNSLPTDLLWLAKAGHVIEFADGTLDLPLPPKAIEKAGTAQEDAAEEPVETEGATDLPITEEPLPDVDAAAQVPVGHAPVGERVPVEEHTPFGEHGPVEEHTSIGDHVPVEEHTPVGEHVPVEEHTPVGEHGPVEERTSIGEHVPVEVHTPVGEHVPVEEHTPVGEHVPVEEHTPVGEHVPVEEHTPVGEHVPVEEHTPVEEHAPVEEHTPVGEQEGAQNVLTPATPIAEQEPASLEVSESKAEPTQEHHEVTPTSSASHDAAPVTQSHDPNPTTESAWATAKS
jgi:acyl-[acyl carrier protein]--UDP-N-acetylglucosamine O-acyltransferase